jgi:23S rRNA pseudouridine1911/1915/1917 synthase
MMSHYSLLVAVICFTLLLTSNWYSVTAFSVLSSSRQHTATTIISQRLWAKPPPTSGFDLEVIEAFEAKMDSETLDFDEVDDSDDSDDGDDVSLEDISSNEDNIRVFTVPEELNGKRIDAVVAALETSISRSVCGNLVTEGNVQLVKGDKTTVLDRKSFKVQAGTTLRVELPKDEKPLEIVAQDLPLDILYEDEHMVVLNKAAGMVVHPAAGNWDGTVVNALAYYLAKSPYGSGDFVGNDDGDEASDELNSMKNNDINPAGADGELVSFRPGIVHRLDKGTTGILVVAKTTQSLAALSGSFAARKVKKTYLAVTVGNPGKRVVINKPIGRHPVHRQRMRVVPDPHKRDSSGMAPKDRILSPSKGGRRALSYVDTLHFDQKLSMVQVRIETGRTHQIRVHLQDRHTPIYGDDVYGIADWNKRLSKTHGIDRPLLHAYRLEIDHPVTGELMVFLAPMAEDMKRIAQAVWPSGPEELPEIFA